MDGYDQARYRGESLLHSIKPSIHEPFCPDNVIWIGFSHSLASYRFSAIPPQGHACEYSLKPLRILGESCRLCQAPSKLRMPRQRTRSEFVPLMPRTGPVSKTLLSAAALAANIREKNFRPVLTKMRHNYGQNQCVFGNLRSRVKTQRCAIRLSRYIGEVLYTRPFCLM